MDKIPPELLKKTFSYLHLQEKLQCTLVCHSWARILVSDGHIFETININDFTTTKSLNQQVKHWEKRNSDDGSHNGNNCRRLFIETQRPFELDMATLERVFPYLKVLSITIKRINTISVDQNIRGLSSISGADQQLDLLNNWRSNIEIVVMSGCDASLFPKIFNTGVYHQLKTLVLCLHGNLHISYIVNIFKRLQNMPKLLRLHVTVPEISKTALEELHRNAPQIVELTLKFKYLSSFDHSGCRNVLPVTRLNILHIVSNSKESEQERNFLFYIKKKYTCLSKFILQCYRYINEITVESEKNGDLKSKQVWNMDSLVLRDDEMNTKTFLAYDFDDFINQLDDYRNIKKVSMALHYSSTISEEMLSKSIFYGLREIQLNSIPLDMNYSTLKEIKDLKILSLNYLQISPRHRPTIKLNVLLEALPKVIETLSLNHVDLTVDHDKVEQQQNQPQCNIFRLELSNVTIGQFVSQFIGYHLSKLKCLVLFKFYSIYEFALPNHRLSYVNLIPECRRFSTFSIYNPKSKGIRVNLLLTRENKTCYYSVPLYEIHYADCLRTEPFGKNDHAKQYVVKPSQFNRQLQYFHFQCNDAQSIYFEDFLVI